LLHSISRFAAILFETGYWVRQIFLFSPNGQFINTGEQLMAAGGQRLERNCSEPFGLPGQTNSRSTALTAGSYIRPFDGPCAVTPPDFGSALAGTHN